MATTYDFLKGVLFHKHKGSDILDLSDYVGSAKGTFTTAYPMTPVVGTYYFAGTDNTTVEGVTYHNGDSAFWDGSAWTRIPAQVMDDELNKENYEFEKAKLFFKTPLITDLTGWGAFQKMRFINKGNPDAVKTNGIYKRLFLTRIWNVGAQSIVIQDSSGVNVSYFYMEGPIKTGVEEITIPESGGSGIELKMLLDWSKFSGAQTINVELDTEYIDGLSGGMDAARLSIINKKVSSGLPWAIGTYRSDTFDSKVIITNLILKFTAKENAYDINGNLKRLFFTFIRNNASNAVVRIGDNTGYLCQYANTGNRTGVENITLSEYLGGGLNATLTIDWDALLGQSYESTSLVDTEINPSLILTSLQSVVEIPYPLDPSVSFLNNVTDKIAFSNLQFFFFEPEKAYKPDGTLRQFYFDYLRNVSTANLFIRIQEVGNVTANGVCYASAAFQSGVQTFTMNEQDNSGIACRLTVDCDIFTNLESPSTSSYGLISEEVVLKGVNYSKYLGIEKVSNNKFPNVLNKIPNFASKLTAGIEDLHIIFIGDSLIAKTDVTNGVYLPANLPPSCTNKNTFYNVWKNIVRNKPIYDRYDSAVNAFTQVGTWTTTGRDFDSPSWTGEFRENGELTKKSVTANASVAFSWDLDTYEKLNFIHRKGPLGTSAATIAITEGNNKVEVKNDSGVWVEANGFIINQYVNPAIAVQGSGYCLYLGNVRTWMRKKTGATGSVTITVSKGNNAETLYYWGTERWNGATVVMSNLARAGRYINTFNDVYLNDIYPRNPDLVIFEIPLVNEVSSNLANEPRIYTDLQDLVWGDRAGFENANSFKNISNNWTDFETILVIPHTSAAWFSGDVERVVAYGLKASTVYNRTKNFILSKGDVAYIEMNNVMINEGKKRNKNIQQTFTGNNNSFFPFFNFTYDNVHPNDLGCQIWGEYVSSIFYDLI